jgi:hypothetical protein
MEQAMSMLMTGGTVGPEEILFTRPATPADALTELVSDHPLMEHDEADFANRPAARDSALSNADAVI